MPETRPTFQERARVEELIQHWLEQTLSPSLAEEFSGLISRFPELGEHSLQQLHTSQLLLETLNPQQQISSALPLAPGQVASGSRWRHVVPLLATALTVGIVVIWASLRTPVVEMEPQENVAATVQPTHSEEAFVSPVPDPQNVITGEPMTDAVAVVSRSLSAVSSHNPSQLDVGSVLSPGLFKLDSGLVCIDFFNGTRFAIEGPADLEIRASNHLFCATGKITAELPSSAREFLIETPQGSIAEASRRIGLAVSPDRTEVHVFQGQAKLKEFAQMRVLQGDALVFTGQQILKRLSADEKSFVSVRKIDEKFAHAVRDQLEKWRKFNDQANQDPSLVARFEFSEIASDPNPVLKNQARFSHVGGGSIVGCQLTKGSWTGQQALTFQSLTDRVCLDIPDQFEAVTMTAWVRLHALPEKFAGLVMSDSNPQGGVHWQLTGDRKIRVCYISDPTTWNKLCELDTPTILGPGLLGKWLHLAVVLDSGRQSAAHYLNGEMLSDGPFLIDNGICIGQASLGNWSRPGNHHSPIRNLQGDLGEVSIHGRVLPQNEIRRIYQAGLPAGVAGPRVMRSADPIQGPVQP
ncbi:LamG domain-containing protein [Planctomicrobium sp. SH661]|uniref:LamG domain-containing protein n=1 Tax=Planctomicrobium sp. SH661 TaxID=3448124 RepID=UPI003F5C71BD